MFSFNLFGGKSVKDKGNRQEIINVSQNGGQTAMIFDQRNKHEQVQEQSISNKDNNAMNIIIDDGYGSFKWVKCQPGCTEPCCNKIETVCPKNCTKNCCQNTKQSDNIIVCQLGCTGSCCHQKTPMSFSYKLSSQQNSLGHSNSHVSYVGEKQDIEIVYKQNVIGGQVLKSEVIRQNSPLIKWNGSNHQKDCNHGQQTIIYKGSGKAWILEDLITFSEKSIPDFYLTPTHLSSSILIPKITKLKALSRSILDNCRILKIVVSENIEYLRAVPFNQHREWFCLTAYAKFVSMKIICDMNACEQKLFGEVYKKSEVLKKWRVRIVRIEDGVLNSSKAMGEQANLTIDNASQIWTRFQTINNGRFIIIKVFHKGGVIKSQFGVPCSKAMMWFRGFYSLLKADSY